MKDSIVLCAAWVPQGKARANPEKVEISVLDLKKIIEETEEKLSSVKLEEDDTVPEKIYDRLEAQEIADAAGVSLDDAEDDAMDTDDKKEEETDIDKLYAIEKYDQEEESNLGQLAQLSRLTVFATPTDDPLIANDGPAKEEEELSEAENHAILPNDNLIAVGHVEDQAAILEVYVYNEEGDALYVHHDNLLPSVPLCMEWLSYCSTEEGVHTGNFVAVGSMGCEIEVWDLDLIDGLEPAYKLGYAPPKEKKSKSKVNKDKKVKKPKKEAYGHTESVMCIAWNKEYEHILASGSADGVVILWDLETQSVSQTIKCCSGRVQSLQWRPNDSITLLACTSDGGLHVIDCNDGSDKSWQLEGEVERALWWQKGLVLACNDQGAVYCINLKKKKPLWSFNAHTTICTSIQLSSSCPGLLLTSSESGSLKVWDTLSSSSGGLQERDGPPALVVELNPQVGRIHCLTPAVEQPFVFCIGGDQGDNCFKVWDIRASLKVRQVFCPRLGLPVDEEFPDNVKLSQQLDDEREPPSIRYFQEPRPCVTGSNATHLAEAVGTVAGGSYRDEASSNNVSNASKETKTSHKKKGGHKERRNRNAK